MESSQCCSSKLMSRGWHDASLAALLAVIAGGLTIAAETLVTTTRAPFDVTALNVQLPFDDTAVVTRPRVRSPVAGLVTVTHARHFNPADCAVGDSLCCRDLLRPALDHEDTAENYFLWFGHVDALTRCDPVRRAATACYAAPAPAKHP